MAMLKVIDKNKIKPAYLQLADELNSAVACGRIKPGGKMPSENALSRKYGIHRHTARKTLKYLANAGVIVSEPGRGWFLKETIDNGTTIVGLYGIPMGNIHSGFYSSFINALFTFGRKNNCILKILSAEDIRLLENKRKCSVNVDCICWAIPKPEDIPLLEKIREQGINIVAANRQLFGTQIPYVAIDQYSGTRELVARLTKAGHRKIGCITSDHPYRYVSERWRGFVDALSAAGIEIESHKILHVLEAEKLKDQLSDFFRENKDMTALFIAGEVFQRQTFKFIAESKINIPEDISIVAFDREMEPLNNCSIVHLEQPVEEMAQALYEIAVNMHKKSQEVSSRVIKPVIFNGTSIKDIN